MECLGRTLVPEMRVANFHRCFDRSADGSDFVVRAVSDEAAFNASKTGIFAVDEGIEMYRSDAAQLTK